MCPCLAIGSGANFAVAASRALIELPDLTSKQIGAFSDRCSAFFSVALACRSAERAMKIAADADIYSNHNFTWETLDIEQIKKNEEKKEKQLEEESKSSLPKTTS